MSLESVISHPDMVHVFEHHRKRALQAGYRLGTVYSIRTDKMVQKGPYHRDVIILAFSRTLLLSQWIATKAIPGKTGTNHIPDIKIFLTFQRC